MDKKKVLRQNQWGYMEHWGQTTTDIDLAHPRRWRWSVWKASTSLLSTLVTPTSPDATIAWTTPS